MIIQIVTTEERVYTVVLFPLYAKPLLPRRLHAKEGLLYVCKRGGEGADGGELFPLAVLLHLMAN